MQRLLVAGSSGFLGARLLRALAGGDRRVLAACRRPEDSPVPPAAAGAEPLALDLATAPIEAVLDDARPDACLSLAALSRGSDCERDPELAEELNARAPERVARWCARAGARLVHVSTDLVFDGEPPDGRPYREDDEPRPLHAYGHTKASGEAAVLAAHPRALVVRLPLLFGDSDGRGLGASDALLESARTGRVARLFRDEWRTPLHVDDAAAALLACLDSGRAGLLHVAGLERLSRYELGVLVLRASGFSDEDVRRAIEPVERADLDLVPPRPRDVSLDASRARSWRVPRPRSVREALATSRA